MGSFINRWKSKTIDKISKHQRGFTIRGQRDSGQELIVVRQSNRTVQGNELIKRSGLRPNASRQNRSDRAKHDRPYHEEVDHRH